MQVVAIMRDVAIMRNVCSRPALSGFKTTVRQRKYLKNFVDVVLTRKHSWTNTAIKCLVLFSSAKQEGSPLIPGEKTQAGLINQRMSLTGWTFPFFTKYLNTCHHQIDGICWWEFGWHYTVMWIMCGEALREVKADMHMELENKRDIDCPT